MKHLAGQILPIAICLLAMLVAGGCNEEVASPTGLDEPFSMFGILNPRLETQSVAVSPMQSLLHDYPDSIDARVTSTDLQTGEVHAWRDSMVVSAVGQVDHIYVADFRPAFGSAHRIEVERSDGARTSAETSIPMEVAVSSADAGSQIFDVAVKGEDFHLLSVDVLYTVRYYDVRIGKVCEAAGKTFTVPYDGRQRKTAAGYGIYVNPEIDHDEVMRQYSIETPISWSPGNTGLALTRMEVRLLVANEAWDPPGGVFEASTLVHPRTMSNVANGYGFVGGGYNLDARLFPSKDVIGASWFFDFIMRPPADCLDYCVCAGE